MTDFASLDLKIDSREVGEGVRELDRLTDAGTRAERGQRAFTGAADIATRSAGQQRAGMQQLSFQIGDVAQQFALGVNPMVIFAQQGGQVVQALNLMKGGASGLVGFLAGPWGAVITGGALILGTMVSQLFNTKKGMDEVKFASNGMKDAQSILGTVIDSTTGKINAQNSALVALARAQLLVASVKARAAAAEAKSGVLAIQDRPVELSGGLGGGFSAQRRSRDARDTISAQVLSGALSGDTAVARLENLRRVGKLTEEQFTTAATAVANFGAETANIKVFADAAKQLDAASKGATVAIGGGRSGGGGGGRSSGGGGGGGLTGAISESARAQEAATKTTDDYITRLTEEIAKMGKTATQLRAMEIARYREGAATDAQRQKIDELNAAREREIARAKISETVLKDLAERRKDLEGAFDGAVEQSSKNREEAFRREQDAANDYRNSIESLVTVLDQVGGRKLGNVGAILGGFATGDFRGATGPVGGVLNALSQSSGGKELLDTFTGKLETLFGGSGQFKKTLQGVLEGAAVGASIGGVLFGKNNKAAKIGGAIGGAIGSTFAGPIGELVGSVLGSAVGSLFKKAKTGSATLGFSANGDLGVTGTSGNSGSRKTAASGLGGSVGSALDSIAEKLGGTATGPLTVSIGVRNKNFKVDTTGAGRTKGAGVLDFGKDEAAALRGAIAEALKDGVIRGISAGAQKLLASGDVEKQLAKAIKFQGVFDDLKQRTDPFGFALQQLGREAEGLKKIFAEAGASAADYAQLEQLLALKRADAAKDQAGASKALKDFLLDLNAGPGSPLSLRQQRVEAEAALAPYSAAIASAQAARAQADSLRASGASADAISAAEQAARLASGKIDQDGFQSAANRLLGISRASDASGAGFFADFDRIRALTSTGIGLIDSSAAADLTPQIAQNTADTAALLVDNNELQKQILAQLQAMNDNNLNGDGFFNVRNFG